ncbi:FtsX-like permease family protein [Actinomadura sp. HBU206391]|uniref:FtsX-like permease family protein n=1 Tax=Actinomadura sp. HBU206391 TaxID=2731692 RepID=UPI001650C647|nr:FtsX-like permease family protein [Actinomadura sp. HBU206391]MBC6456651.1 ABC transporter permease [Actinomadura sp. HBU206391]
MLYLASRMARHRIAALLAIACATLGGAAFLTGIGVLAESGLRSHAPVDRLARADIVVSADQTFTPDGDLPIALPERARVPGELVGRLARLPGVTAAIGDLSFPAAAVDQRGGAVPGGDPRAAGHGWSSTALLDRPHVAGTAPAGPLEVAVDDDTAAAAGVAPGGRLQVIAAGHRATYRVSAVVTTADAGIFFADSTAMRLAGQGSKAGTVDLVALRTAPGAGASVAAKARDLARGGGLVVSTGSARGDVQAPEVMAARGLLPMLAGSLAGVTLLVVGFIVGGALAVSIGAQRRDLALMRAVGATPRQVRRLASAQAVILTVATLLPGIPLGYLLAERLRLLLVSAGMLPSSLPLTFGPLPAVAAALLLVVVVQVSAWCASWRTSRMPATEAVAESHSEPRTPSKGRAFAGVLVLIAANVVSVAPLLARSQAGAAVTALAGILAAIGLGLAGPVLVSRIGRALRKVSSRASAPTWLAVANSHGYAMRVAGAITTLAMAVVFTLTYALTQTTVLKATSDDVSAGTRAQFSMSAPGLGGVPDDLAAAVRATPGVQAAAPVTTTTVMWPHEMAGDVEVDAQSARVLTPAAPGVLDLDVRAGSLAKLTGNTVAVDAGVARTRKASVGSTVHLILGDGARVDARVVATYARGLGFGPVALSSDLAAGHTTTGLDQSILIRTDGTDTARRGLAAFAASRPGLALGDATRTPGGQSTIPPELWINVAILTVLLGYLLLGIANKLIATTAGRRHELAALQLIGATPRQIRSMMRREAALICTVALSTGLLLSVVPLALLGLSFLHRPWPAGPVWLAPTVAVVVAGIAFLTMEIPTRRALRTPPAQALTRG